MTFIREIVPDIVYWIAFKDNEEQNAQVKDQVAPNQCVTGPIDRSRLRRCENVYELE